MTVEGRQNDRAAVTSARIVLRALVKLLEPEAGKIGRGDFSYWGDEQPPEQRSRSTVGTMHLATALRIARAALASGDDARILEAAIHCAPFERIGRDKGHKVEAAARENEVAKRRSSGGRQTAAFRAGEAAKVWAPWYARFLELTAPPKAKSKPAARRIIHNEMVRACFTLESTGACPSERTLRARLK